MDSVNIVLETKDFVITEADGRIHTSSKVGDYGVIQALGKLVYKLMSDSDTQPMAALGVNSEPDLLHYHFHVEHQESGLTFSCAFSANAVKQDSFNPSDLKRKIKEKACKLAHENENINSEPEDWVVKYISRLWGVI